MSDLIANRKACHIPTQNLDLRIDSIFHHHSPSLTTCITTTHHHSPPASPQLNTTHHLHHHNSPPVTTCITTTHHHSQHLVNLSTTIIKMKLYDKKITYTSLKLLLIRCTWIALVMQSTLTNRLQLTELHAESGARRGYLITFITCPLVKNIFHRCFNIHR